VAQKQSELDNLRLRRTAVERELATRLDSAGTALTKANSERIAALADLGRGILLTRHQVPIDERHVTELLRFDDAVAALFQREQLYAAAIANYDRAAVKRGIQLTGLVLLLLLVWCAWRIFA
jgi:aminoglycoside/choline kinase family phosphotransferase